MADPMIPFMYKPNGIVSQESVQEVLACLISLLLRMGKLISHALSRAPGTISFQEDLPDLLIGFSFLGFTGMSIQMF